MTLPASGAASTADCTVLKSPEPSAATVTRACAHSPAGRHSTARRPRVIVGSSNFTVCAVGHRVKANLLKGSFSDPAVLQPRAGAKPPHQGLHDVDFVLLLS